MTKQRARYYEISPGIFSPLNDGDTGPSELATPKTAGPAKVVAAVATCSGAVSSADVLEIARLLEMQACDKDQTPADAGLLMYCTEVLRQHAAAMTERQPLPNIPNHQRAASAEGQK